VRYDILSVVSLRYKSSRTLHHFVGSNFRYFKGLYCLIYEIKQSEKSSRVSQMVYYLGVDEKKAREVSQWGDSEILFFPGKFHSVLLCNKHVCI